MCWLEASNTHIASTTDVANEPEAITTAANQGKMHQTEYYINIYPTQVINSPRLVVAENEHHSSQCSTRHKILTENCHDCFRKWKQQYFASYSTGHHSTRLGNLTRPQYIHLCNESLAIYWGLVGIFTWRSLKKQLMCEQRTAPALEVRHRTAPALEVRQRTVSALEMRQRTAPVLEMRQLTTPALEVRQRTAPALEGKQRTAPALQVRQRRALALEVKQRTAPLHVRQRTTSLHARQRTTSLHARKSISPLHARQSTTQLQVRQRTTSLLR